MIGRLRGILLEKQPPELLIEVGGVAYEVHASMQTFYLLDQSSIQSEIILYTHMVVREDSQQLYGFYDKHERAIFRALLKVNGVGPKLALTILSSISPQEFTRCITQNDTLSLLRLPGVGKKTAERLVIEMRDRLKEFQAYTHMTLPGISLDPQHIVLQDAINALIALGYKPHEASRVLQGVALENYSSENLIRFALKNLI